MTDNAKEPDLQKKREWETDAGYASRMAWLRRMTSDKGERPDRTTSNSSDTAPFSH